MKTETLEPGREAVEIRGKLYYSESFAAWNSLRLAKGVIQEFPQLKQKRSSFIYRMVICRDRLDFERKFHLIKSGKEAIPVLMWIERVRSDLDI